MADIGDWDMDGGDRAGGAPLVNGGLLDPRTFPTPWPPAPASPSPDQDVRDEVERDIQAAQAKLRPIGAQAADDPTDGEWLERSPPLIKRGLDTDTHAEVMRDILNAQAKLPPVQAPQDDSTMVVNGQKYSVLKARTFDPALSNGQMAMPDPGMFAAGIAGAGTVAVPYGTAEKMGFMVPFPAPLNPADVDPMTGLVSTIRMQPTVLAPSAGVTTGSTARGDTASGNPPANALAVVHGHIDDGPADADGSPIRSDGMVDLPAGNGGYGDVDSLYKLNVPTATVSAGRVGWHGIDNGQLKFIYPQGSMTPEQIAQMQKNLDEEQKKFLRPQ